MKHYNKQTDIDIFNIILQKHKLNFKYTIPQSMLNRLRITTFVDPICNQYLIDLQTYIAKLQEDEEVIEEIEEEPQQIVERQHETYNFPKTPWDFFKEKYFPEFLKRIFPVHYKIMMFECVLNTKIINKHITKKCINKFCPHIEMNSRTE